MEVLWDATRTLQPKDLLPTETTVCRGETESLYVSFTSLLGTLGRGGLVGGVNAQSYRVGTLLHTANGGWVVVPVAVNTYQLPTPAITHTHTHLIICCLGTKAQSLIVCQEVQSGRKTEEWALGWVESTGGCPKLGGIKYLLSPPAPPT